MRHLVYRAQWAAAAALLVALTTVAPAAAQEPQLVEEVVAHVNADVITSSQYLQVVKETEADFLSNLKGEEGARKFAEFRPKILDLMIDNLLLVQRGQELGIDVEGPINEQFTRLAREQRMSITEFEEAMRKSGIDPTEARGRLREKFMRDAVLNQEVYGQIFRGLTDREKREYYEKNKNRFLKPGELKLSELFLPVEGRSFSEIEAKAKEIAASARSGASFPDLVKKHGDPTRASFANGGTLGSFKSASELAETLAKAVEPLKAGEVSDPIRMTDGVLILRMDERRDDAPRPYQEVASDVALAMVYERSQEAEQKYVQKLRADAYISITKGYESTASAKQ